MSENVSETKILDHYLITSQMTEEICNNIIKDFFDKQYLKKSVVGHKNKFNQEIRSSTNRWISSDSWVAGMMSHFILYANKNWFNFDLDNWNEPIQFTVYEPQDYYNWHIDMVSKFRNNTIRKLSMVMCLSSKNDYGGGELELSYPSKKTKIFKLDVGDVLIFPSLLYHRVNPITWGRRISLVGWYGGPPFR